MNKGLKILKRFMVVLLAFLMVAECFVTSYAENGTSKSSEAGSNNVNSCYSLAGCKFQLTSKRTGEIMPQVLVTDENGETEEMELPVGEYIVKEIEAPPGYVLSTEEQILTVTKDGIGTVEFLDEPCSDPVGISLKKMKRKTETELLKNVPLEGAEYAVKVYGGYYETEKELEKIDPLRTWVFNTDENGEIRFKDLNNCKVSGDEFYIDDYGRIVFPLGTVTIQETKAPEGYLLEDTLYIIQLKQKSSGSSEVVKELVNFSVDSEFSNALKDSVLEVTEPCIRGDLKGIKVSAGDNKRLANVPFKITNVTSGESHVVITDKNGEFNTSASFNPHSQNTNRGETSKDGVWFGNLDDLDDNRGALPYGAYIIEELPCESNKDKILIAPFEIDITKNDTVVDLGTLINEYIPIPDIGTSATEKSSGLQVTYADKETTIVDEVNYTNLTKGEKYIIKGTLMDKSTSEPLLVNGKQVTAEKTFTPEKTYGAVELEFTFDSSALKGKDIVVFENLYCDGKEVASHADIKDKNQTIKFAEPEIGTSATDKTTGERTSCVGKNTTIIDKVTYRNLIKDREYTVKGVLMDKSTKEPLLVNGKQVTAEKTFIAESSNGTINLEFTFDSSGLKGKKVVVFEHLYYGENEIASHADIKDKKQTVEFKKSSKTTGAVKTGDKVSVFVIVLLLVVSLGGAVFIFVKDKKDKKKKER